MRITTFLPFLLAFSAFGQTSTFDTGNEGWKTFGDATSPNAAWISTGGNPGGHIRVTDESTGGTWHFVAPAKFLGNKCDAYGTTFRYDQYTSDTTAEDLYSNRPDVILFGSGLVLVFENPENPNLTWTHYEVPLREDAGWRLNSITGPVPTEAQFRKVLSTLSGLRIRGEYRALDDFGGLDNVVLQSGFGFDLDGDDSSGALNGNFLADTSCIPHSAVVDLDATLFSEKKIDSIVVRIESGKPEETLEPDVIPGGLDVQMPSQQQINLLNGGNAATADFLAALQGILYRDLSAVPARGIRTVIFRIYTECGEVAVRQAWIPIFTPPFAGENGDTLVCDRSAPFNLYDVLRGLPETGGVWSPLPASGYGLFDPARDAAGQYAYVFKPAGNCPGDTAFVSLAVEPAGQLRSDTTICFGDTLSLRVPAGVKHWQWSDGSHREALAVEAPGVFALLGQTENCTFTDSVRVDFYTCQPCPVYAPNIFSPNDDGLNDTWQIFLPCAWYRFRLDVYNRWGGLVFTADDPEKGWDGFSRGREPIPGVYVWRLEWTGELFGEPKVWKMKGDVTVLR